MTDVDKARLEGADIGVIVAYFAIVMIFGIVSSLRNRGSVGGYFLAGRSMHWIPVGASLFASNIGSGHFIGLAGSGAASGIGIAAFELNALFVLLILGWVFVPVYMSSGVFTMPEYLRKRFGGQRIRVYLAVMALLLSIFTKVAADLFAGAIFIEQSLRWNLYAAIVLLLALSALFTITGGLTAVIWTDFIQTVIMLGGAFALMIVGFIRVGGYEGVVEKYPYSYSNKTKFFLNHPHHLLNDSSARCGIPRSDSFHLFRSYDDSDLPWVGITFGLTISAVWYWCSDQVIVQRALASKDLSHAKGGCILAGYLKILPMWLLVVPGMMARILFTDTVACADPDTCERVCNQRSGCTNIAYPTLVLELMPVGAKGLMLAVMMAALMSSLTSIFNSSSTLFTIDIWRRIRKNSSDMELMIVGRVFVLFMVAVGIIWIPIVRNFAELFHYIQSITSYLAPPVCAIYVLAVFWPRCNEKGAFWSLMVGLVVGLTRFIWEFSYSRPACGEPDNRPAIIKDVHYLHFGILLWGLTTIVAIIISLVTKPMPDETLPRLTFWSRYSKRPRVDIYDYNRKKKEEEEMKKRAEDENYEMKTGKKHGIDGPAAEPRNENTDTPASSGGAFSAENFDSFPWYKKAAFWICGIEKSKEPELSDEEKAAEEAKHTSLEERPLWKRVVTINALILMVIAIFLWGFFA